MEKQMFFKAYVNSRLVSKCNIYFLRVNLGICMLINTLLILNIHRPGLLGRLIIEKTSLEKRCREKALEQRESIKMKWD